MLIVSNTEKSLAYFMEVLSQEPLKEIIIVSGCEEARQLMLARCFDLCVINTPLSDGFGEKLAIEAAARGACQVILVVRAELFDEVSERVGASGVFAIPKPMGKGVFANSVHLARAAFAKVSALRGENERLLQQIEDLRVIDRAKCLLVSCLRMTEPEAHRYLEKQAMDMRTTRLTVAQGVIRTYEN
ncbi:MAG: ANTAR domain-containing protein [Oscillospiraceae bacterium]|nr:ANTAR domain-containing protein [Oscillospiraceae bacterium]